MKSKNYLIWALAVVLFSSIDAFAQYKDKGTQRIGLLPRLSAFELLNQEHVKKGSVAYRRQHGEEGFYHYNGVCWELIGKCKPMNLGLGYEGLLEKHAVSLQNGFWQGPLYQLELGAWQDGQPHHLFQINDGFRGYFDSQLKYLARDLLSTLINR